MVRQWSGKQFEGKYKGRNHIYFLVFEDKMTPVDLSSWEATQRDLINAETALGFVSLSVADQPTGDLDIHTYRGKFSTTTFYGKKTSYGSAETLIEQATVCIGRPLGLAATTPSGRVERNRARSTALHPGE